MPKKAVRFAAPARQGTTTVAQMVSLPNAVVGGGKAGAIQG